jgi:hypothetical protein
VFPKPERKVELHYYKCRLKCDAPYGIMHTSKVEAERSWMNHAFTKHRGKIHKIPPYVIKSKMFKAVKE